MCVFACMCVFVCVYDVSRTCGLVQHNTCPVCRYGLPTDDPDYNARRRVVEENLRRQMDSAPRLPRRQPQPYSHRRSPPSDGCNVRETRSHNPTMPPTRGFEWSVQADTPWGNFNRSSNTTHPPPTQSRPTHSFPSNHPPSGVWDVFGTWSRMWSNSSRDSPR